MKSRSLCFIIVIMIFSLSCKKQDNTSAANKSLVLEYITKTNALKDTLINDINIEKTENIKNEDRDKIIQLYFSSFQKDDIEPNIAFDEVKKDHSKIEVKKYVTEIAIDSVQVLIEKYCAISYRIKYNDSTFESKTYYTTEEEYALWGNDDNYIINLVLTKEGVSA